MPTTATRPMNVTFIGIGAIGLPMAHQLAQAGHHVTCVDPSEPQRARATAEGLSAEAAPESAAEADVVIVMVATPEQLRTVTLGGSGLIARMRAGATLIVMSTVSPESVQELRGPADSADVVLLDVPVTGGVAGAQRGALRLLAAGPREALARNSEVLEAMGTIVECGTEVGTGQSVKAVNQLLCSVHIVAAAEALALAEKLDLDPEAVLEAVSTGAAGSWMLADRGPRMLEGLDAEVRSAIGIFVKDTGLVEEIAESTGLETPMLTAARSRYLQAAEAGLLAKDDSQVIQTYR